MRITRQSIKWLGNNRVRISTTRSKHKSGTSIRIGWFGVRTPSRHRSNNVTDTIAMEPERFKVERERIQRGLFRDYDPEKYYRYDENAAYFPEEKFKKGLRRFVNLFRAENRQKFAEEFQKGKQQVEKGLENATVDNSAEPSPSRSLNPLPATMWWKVAIAATVFSFIPFFTPGGTIGAVAAAVYFFSWIALPIALYKDTDITTAISNGWSPRRWLYVIGAIVPVLSVIAGTLYLGRRWNHNRAAEPGEEALLRQQYARGKIDIDEFENQVENVLEAETPPGDRPR